MIEVGRWAIKIAGRDAGKKCVIVDIVDKNTVLIDGETRRRKCSIKHLELLKGKADIKKEASHADIVSVFKKLSIEIKEKKSKEKTERPRKVRKKKEKPGTQTKSDSSLEETTEKKKKTKK